MSATEQVRLSEILIIVPQPSNSTQVAEAQHKAKQLREAIRHGGTFADIAKANDQGPTAAHGGDLRCFARGTLAEELGQLVFRMRVGDVSPVIRTKQGFVILEVSDRGPHPCADLAIPKQGVPSGQATPPSTDHHSEPPANSSDQKHENKTSYGPIDVLTDTQGVDFGPYLRDVVAIVRRNWYSLIPSQRKRRSRKKERSTSSSPL